MFFKDFDNGRLRSKITGERFSVTYTIKGNAREALDRARDICIEQTVEFPVDLIPEGAMRDSVCGRIESFEDLKNDACRAVISYAAEVATDELTQLINVIFGNISLMGGIRVERFDLPPSMLKRFKGPRFGIEDIRAITSVHERPLLFAVLKPMGLSPGDMADLAYRYASGGMDVIKDDHGLTDQIFCPFRERVALCAEAVNRANRETGKKTIYLPNVTASFDKIVERARFARDVGAGGILVEPGLTGIDAMRYLAEDDDIAAPIFSQPALQGTCLLGESGLSHYSLLGLINRIAGADGVIFPHAGGRFSFSEDECRDIVKGCREEMGGLRPIFPCPGGGLTPDRIAGVTRFYGKDAIFLIGGGLFRQGPDIIENCRRLLKAVQDTQQGASARHG